jgi:hypothetical protein
MADAEQLISAHLVPNPGVKRLDGPTIAPVIIPIPGSTPQNSSSSGDSSLN